MSVVGQILVEEIPLKVIFLMEGGQIIQMKDQVLFVKYVENLDIQLLGVTIILIIFVNLKKITLLPLLHLHQTELIQISTRILVLLIISLVILRDT